MARKAKSMKIRIAAGALALSGVFAALAQVVAQPAPGSNRIALVIGEAAYKTGPLSSAANDAGLIAQTLQVAGFDVTGAADLNQDELRKTLREFVEKAASAGTDATVFIYLSGRALQYEGENYFAPVDAAIPAAASVPLESVRLSDYLTPLAQMPLKSRIVVVDGARVNTFAAQGTPLAGGLALVDPPQGELIAFNAAPGSVAPQENGPYGVYAQALNEMMRQGGLPVDQMFDSVRLRVAEQTKGALIPWDESRLAPAPVLMARAENAPPLRAAPDLRTRPIREYSVDQAYAAALERDTIVGYTDFLAAFPNSPYSARVRALLAIRREALTWRRAWSGNTPEAYWTYLQRFPRGPHAEDARLRLAALRAELAPPSHFAELEFDVPPPPEYEVQEDAVYFRRPYVVFDQPDYGPPPPVIEVLPPPVWYDAPPPPRPERGLLPLPLVAAPLLFAVPAIRHGLFQAPAPVQAQNPGAQQFYDQHARPAPAQPGGAPAAPQPVAPAPGQNAAPQPAPGGHPLPTPNARPASPAAQQPPAAPPAPAVTPPAQQAPKPIFNEPAPHQAPAAPPHAAPPPAPHVAPPPPPPAQQAPRPIFNEPAPHQPPAAPPHPAPPPPAPHVAPPPPPAQQAPKPIFNEPAPHQAPAAPPHAAPPPPPPAPHVVAPPPPPPHEKPRCGGPGEPRC